MKVDEYAFSKDVAGLLKSDIVINEGKHKWRVNLQTLVQGYRHIGEFSLKEGN